MSGTGVDDETKGHGHLRGARYDRYCLKARIVLKLRLRSANERKRNLVSRAAEHLMCRDVVRASHAFLTASSEIIERGVRVGAYEASGWPGGEQSRQQVAQLHNSQRFASCHGKWSLLHRAAVTIGHPRDYC